MTSDQSASERDQRSPSDPLFDSVLLAVMGDLEQTPPGLAPATYLADGIGARLTVHRTVHPSAGIRMRRVWSRPHNRQAATDHLIADSAERLGRFIGTTEASPSRDVVVAVGRWPESLVAEVHHAGHDLVVVSVEGDRHAVPQIRRLLRVCPCALLVTSGGLETGPVIAAIDPADSETQNRSILRLASKFAEINNDHVHVVHAVGDGAPGSEHEHTVAASIDQPADAADRKRRPTRAVTKLVEDAALTDGSKIHIEFGNPVEVAAQTAAEVGATLVIVGSTGRLGTKQRLTGNTVERLLASRRQSVLVVKPSFDEHRTRGRKMNIQR